MHLGRKIQTLQIITFRNRVKIKIAIVIGTERVVHMKIKNTLTELKIVKAVAVVLTVLHFVSCSIGVWSQNVAISAEADILAGLLFYFLPFPTIFSWIMYIERYVHWNCVLSGVEDKKAIHRQCYEKLIYVAICAFCFEGSLLAVVYFVANYKEYLAGLSTYLCVIVLLAAFWLFYLMFTIKRIRKNSLESGREKNKKAYKITLLVLAPISILGILLLIYEADSVVFLRRMLEEV